MLRILNAHAAHVVIFLVGSVALDVCDSCGSRWRNRNRRIKMMRDGSAAVGIVCAYSYIQTAWLSAFKSVQHGLPVQFVSIFIIVRFTKNSILLRIGKCVAVECIATIFFSGVGVVGGYREIADTVVVVHFKHKVNYGVAARGFKLVDRQLH